MQYSMLSMHDFSVEMAWMLHDASIESTVSTSVESLKFYDVLCLDIRSATEFQNGRVRYGADCSLRKCPGTVCYADSSTKETVTLQ